MSGTQTVKGFRPAREFFDGAGDAGGDAGGGGDPPKLPDGAIMLEKFKDALPEDVRTHGSMSKITTLEDMGRSFISAQRFIGADPATLMHIPSRDDDGTAFRGVMTKLGLPEKIEDYGIKAADDTPPWLALDQELSKSFLEMAHKEGVVPRHAQATYNWFTGAMKQIEADATTKENALADTQVRELEALWGTGDAFNQNMARVNHTIDKLGGSALVEALNKANLGTLPVLMTSLLKVHGLMVEDSAGDDNAGDTFGGALTPDDAKSRGKALLQQAMNEKNNAEKKRLNEEAQKFFAIATGGK